MPAKLTLTHKLGLMVLIPLAVNWYFYSHTHTKVKELEKLVDELADRRAVASAANSLITNEFFALQALMQYKMFRDKGDRKDFDVYMGKMAESIDTLETLLAKKLNDPATASRMHFRNAELMHALKVSDFHPDAENQFGSFFEDLERNRRVKHAMLGLIETLREIDLSAKTAVEAGISAEKISRAELRRSFDLLVLINSLMTIAIVLFISKLIVKPVNTIAENFNRVSNHEPLLEPIKSDDELEELDKNFRGMLDKLEANRQSQLEMMQQISSSRDSLQTVIDVLPAALFITDAEGRVESINKFAKDFFDIDLNYFHENNLSKMFQLSAEQRANFVSLLEGESASALADLFAVTPDKELVPVKVSTVSFENNKEKKFLTVVADETESYRLQQARSDFFSMVSHDMRTPLSTISGVLQMAIKGAHGSVNKETAERLEVAMRSSSVLLELVNRLLKIEQMDTTDIELNQENFDIADLAKDVASIITPQLEGKNLSLINEIESQSVFADRAYIEEVVMNLVSNAIKYSPEGGEIKLSNRLENSQVVVEVADQGPGVPTSKRSTIFERYRQADRKRDSKVGFGLGLAICKAIILRHGGAIGVRDAKDGGSVFWFSLQCKNGEC
ncbi:MAG: hypothetical protein IT343_12360 [Candidatus Melainabacteria bacterium]|jgi:signal transduction histidine kinase/HAMP domain-containing protein|nr:hypothetical protein [Candidatus Melainabacteria bacterium]